MVFLLTIFRKCAILLLKFLQMGFAMIEEFIWKPIKSEDGTKGELLELIEILKAAQKEKPKSDEEIDWEDIDE